MPHALSMGPAEGLIDQPVLLMGTFDCSSPTSFVFADAAASESSGEDVVMLLVGDARCKRGFGVVML